MPVRPRLPDFLIVGTMKSGTTTLADYLGLHPRIWIPAAELHYFNNDDNFVQGPDWYAQRLVEGCTRDEAPGLQLGEKTPAYSYHPKCLPRMLELVPRARLIWVFRNPVDRTFSNYLHRVKKGSELYSFRAAIAQEERRVREHISRGYVERSKYADQVERFLEAYPRKQMHFLLFENLVAGRQEELDKVAAFLGLEPFPAMPAERASNSTSMPFSPLSLWLAQKLFGQRSRPFKLVQRANYLFAKAKPRIPRDLRQQLAERFAAHNERLTALTGLDLSVWNRGDRERSAAASSGQQGSGDP